MVEYFSCILGKKHSLITTTIKLDGIDVAEPETIANAFNSISSHNIE